MLYTASSLALACLETLVHTQSTNMPPLVWSSTEVPEPIDRIKLKLNVRHSHVLETRELGHRWIHEAGELAIRVSSVVIPAEDNVLLNPTHTGYSSLVWHGPEAFEWDNRLADLILKAFDQDPNERLPEGVHRVKFS